MPEPLILLPGLICDTRMFAGQVAAFPQAIARPGFGGCDSLPAMARQVLDAAPPRFALLGHSMGARVALEVVRLAPERVSRLALVSTGTHPVQPREAEKRHALRDLGRAEGMAALVDRWLPPMIAPQRQADAALVADLRAMCIAAGLDAFEAQVRALLARPSVDELLPAIRCPTLVATGALDVWSPPAQHRGIADAIPHAQLAVVPDAGHMLPAEAADALNTLIADWLARPAAPATRYQGEDA